MWLVVLRIYVASTVFQPYLDLEAGDNQSLKIHVARLGIEPKSSCSTNQELNHSATVAPGSGWRYTLFMLTNQNHSYMPKLNDISIFLFYPLFLQKVSMYKTSIISIPLLIS